MALMNAGEPDMYKDLQDVLDPYEKQRPQRHNIIFEDGWPTGQWYSTEKLARGQDGEKRNPAEIPVPSFMADWSTAKVAPSFLDWPKLTENIVDEIMDNMDLDSLQEEIAGTILNELDMDALRNEIMESVKNSLNISN